MSACFGNKLPRKNGIWIKVSLRKVENREDGELCSFHENVKSDLGHLQIRRVVKLEKIAENDLLPDPRNETVMCIILLREE